MLSQRTYSRVVGAGPATNRVDFKNTCKDVPDRQYREDPVGTGEKDRDDRGLGHYVAVTQHHPLRAAGRSGGVDNGEEILRLEAVYSRLGTPVAPGSQLCTCYPDLFEAADKIGRAACRDGVGREVDAGG